MPRPRIPLLRSAIAALALASTLWLPPVAASAIPLAPGEFLMVDFGFSSPPQTLVGDIDVLTFEISSVSPSSGLTGIRIDLFDGATLLGSQGGNGDVRFFWSWKTPGSQWDLMSPEVADLSSVIDGSIDGRIVLTPFFDPLATDPFLDVQFPRVRTGTATSETTLLFGAPAPDVSIEVVPEPGVAALLAAAGFLLVTLRR